MSEQSAATPNQECRAHDLAPAPADPYTDLLSRFKQDHVPFTVQWELTHACNLDCLMCYNQPLDQPELSTRECFDILLQLAAAGALQLTLTGGEILVRRDFFEIAERARSLGFALNLKTNGTLITAERADRIAALAPVQVDISLLGATGSTFDRIAGRRNTLQRVLGGVKLLQDRHVRVKLNTLLMDLNINERQQMAELAMDLGVQYEQVFKIAPTDDGSDRAGRHQLGRDQITTALSADRASFTMRQPRPHSRPCSVGLSSCLISPYGEVFPCIELRLSAGNLRRQNFSDIWDQAPIFQELRARHTYQYLPDCQMCPLLGYCEGRCSGLAMKEHGDLYGGHSQACHQAQARYAQLHPNTPIPTTPFLNRRPGNPNEPPSKPPTVVTQPIALFFESERAGVQIELASAPSSALHELHS